LGSAKRGSEMRKRGGERGRKKEKERANDGGKRGRKKGNRENFSIN
jgi:hypothetical protein